MALLSDNPKYIVALQHQAATFYMPAEITAYHKSREMAMQAQDHYSRCGISREVLQSFTEKILADVNKELNIGTLRSDMAVIANNLNYRMSNIVDEDCILRMAAYGLMLVNEPPDEVLEVWTQRKIALANQHPEIKAFFLHMGVAFTPEYANLLRGLEVAEYLMDRQIVLNGLTLQGTPAAT